MSNSPIAYLRGQHLTELPPLPDTVKTLVCSYNYLERIENLPPRLEQLHCDYNASLQSIGPLPPTLQDLGCSNTALRELPTLPKGIRYVDCHNAQIRTLPFLPSSLELFKCRGNPLVEPYRTFAEKLDDDYNHVAYTLENFKNDVNEYNARKIHKQHMPGIKEELVAARFHPNKIQRNMNRNHVNPEGYMNQENWEKYFTRRGEVWTHGVGTKKGGKRKGRKSSRQKTQKKRR